MTDTPMSAEERAKRLVKRLGAITRYEGKGTYQDEAIAGGEIRQAEAAAWKAGQQEGYELGYEKAVMSEAAQAVGRKAALEEAGERVCLVCERRIRALSEKPQ